MQVTVRFGLMFHPKLGGEPSVAVREVSPPLSPSTNPTRGLAARRLLNYPMPQGLYIYKHPYSLLGLRNHPYGTAISVANHYTGWVTIVHIDW
ncbi:hypothetical protein TNCV_3478331 [Trichonephila clavipes]|nr:hypothetical protein TNCV_3478331 [Trichonephila clavipes]